MKIKNYNLDFRRKIKNFKLNFRRIVRFFPPRKSSLRENSRSPLRLNCGEPWPLEFSRCGSNQVLRLFCLFILIIFFSITIWGCGLRQGAEETKKAVLEFDPRFKDALAKKAESDAQIDLLMTDFRNKQSEINSKIMELEEELKVIRRQTYSQVRQLKAQLDPERQSIILKLNELRATLKSKEGLAKTLKDSLRETKKLIEKNKKLGLSQEEEFKWQKNLDDLNSQLVPLEAEIAGIKKKIDLYRQELNLLKQ